MVWLKLVRIAKQSVVADRLPAILGLVSDLEIPFWLFYRIVASNVGVFLFSFVICLCVSESERDSMR